MRRSLLFFLALGMILTLGAGIRLNLQQRQDAKRRKVIEHLGIPPEAEIVSLHHWDAELTWGYSYTAEVRLPQPPSPKQWMVTLAERCEMPQHRKGPYLYKAQSGDAGAEISYNAKTGLYRFHRHF